MARIARYTKRMGRAARAIHIEDEKILVMHRNKEGSQYFTLPGGRAEHDESAQQTLRREIKEECGMDITSEQMVFYEGHPEPYNQQYIFLCKVAKHGDVSVQEWSEE